MRRILVAGACACVLGMVGSAQAPRVLLDFVVDAPGEPAPLSQGDVTVSDAMGMLPVVSLRLVDAANARSLPPLPPVTTAEEERAAAARAERLVAIFLDEYHLAAGPSLEASRDALAAFVRTALGPRDLVVVLKPLASLTAIRLSTDRESAARAIESSEGRRDDLSARSAFEQEFIAGAPERISEARSQIALSAVNALSTHLGQFDTGRKTLLIVTDQVDVPGERRRRDVLPGLGSIQRAATRGRVAIYALSPSGDEAAMRAGTAAADGEGRNWAWLATSSGGITGVGSPDIATALQQIGRESGRYYLLALEPRAGQLDGGIHPLRVAVRRPGLRVRTRGAFSVPEPVESPKPSSLSAFAPTRTIPRRVSPLIRPWFGVQGGSADRVRVHFVWEPSPRRAGDRAGGTPPARIRLAVSTLDGTPVYSGAAVAATAERLVPGVAEPSRLAFDTVPGPLLVQMEILDPAGRVLDRDVRDLSVRPFGAPVAFGTPEVFRARTRRELQRILGSDEPVPIAAREFSRTEHLVVRVPLVGTGGAEVSARLVSGFGTVMRTLPVTPVTGATVSYQVDLALNGLVPGAYSVQFAARVPTGAISEPLPFTLLP